MSDCHLQSSKRIGRDQPDGRRRGSFCILVDIVVESDLLK